MLTKSRGELAKAPSAEMMNGSYCCLEMGAKNGSNSMRGRVKLHIWLKAIKELWDE